MGVSLAPCLAGREGAQRSPPKVAPTLEVATPCSLRVGLHIHCLLGPSEGTRQTSQGCVYRRQRRQFWHGGALLELFTFPALRAVRSAVGGCKNSGRRVLTLCVMAVALWSRLVLRATLGGRCWHPHLTDEAAEVHSFIPGFLHSLASRGLNTHQAPRHRDKSGNCTLGPYWLFPSFSEGETICPVAQREQQRCPRPHSQKCQGHFALERAR